MRTVLIIIGSLILVAGIITAVTMTAVQGNANADKYAQCVINADEGYPSSDGPAADKYRHDLEQQCKTKYQH